jgi:hypothetical protein
MGKGILTDDGDGDGGILVHRTGDGGILVHRNGDDGILVHRNADDGILVHRTGDGGILVHRTDDGILVIEDKPIGPWKDKDSLFPWPRNINGTFGWPEVRPRKAVYSDGTVKIYVEERVVPWKPFDPNATYIEAAPQGQNRGLSNREWESAMIFRWSLLTKGCGSYKRV